MSDPAGPTIHELEMQRRQKREEVARLGLDPYGTLTTGLTPLADAGARYDEAADTEHKSRAPEPNFVDRRPMVRVAGRIVLHRDNGKLIWLNLRDHTGNLQVAVSKRDCDDAGFQLAKLSDLSDIVVAEGPLTKTKTGEVTVWASRLRPGAKSLVPPPEKHAGLQDTEIRYRQRYVDLWANPEVLRVFELRSRIVSRVRDFMAGRGYLEVETPMLQPLAGGAAARPFVTPMNALSIDLYLRIAPELYLKRLLVGGLPRVFEINRNFRNEGLDKQHNPEFTMLEAYHAFGNVETVMELTESLVRDAARMVGECATGSDSSAGAPRSPSGLPEGVAESSRPGEVLHLPFGDTTIDYESPFARITYAELFERALGFPMSDADRCRAEAGRRHVLPEDAIRRLDPILVANELFEEVAEKSLDPAKPTFIMEYPSALSPLTRPKRDNPAVAERADLFIGHMEIAPHYTELNDPDVQEAKFREQLAGLDAETAAEESTFRTFDHDFIRALKVGMPPAGGMGLGIDRLVMLLTNQRTIRDVMLFPMMRPE